MSATIKIDSLSSQLEEILKDYGSEVNTKLEKETKKVMKTLVENTKRDAPVSELTSGTHYRDSIARKTLTSDSNKKSEMWYVKAPNYRIAHLLNDGHATKNGGRVDGDDHITKNADIAIKDYEEKVKGIIDGTVT